MTISARGVAASGPASAGPDAALEIRRRPHRLEIVGWIVLAFLLSLLVHNMVTNENWSWDVVGKYLLNRQVLEGLKNTILLTLLSGLTGTVFGLVVAAMRLSRSPLLRGVSTAFVGFMRAIPALVLLLLIYFTGALFPKFGLGVPYTDTYFFEVPLNSIITQFVASWLGLTLIMGAHTGEIFRGGILAVPGGQVEAARALGLSPGLTFFRVVLPQMIRVAIPALANELISLFKNTSLVSVIGYTELLTVVQSIYGRTYQTIPLLIVACIWYLAIVIVSMIGQRALERRFSRGFGAGANSE